MGKVAAHMHQIRVYSEDYDIFKIPPAKQLKIDGTADAEDEQCICQKSRAAKSDGTEAKINQEPMMDCDRCHRYELQELSNLKVVSS